MSTLLSYRFRDDMVPLGFQCEAALRACDEPVIRCDVDRRFPASLLTPVTLKPSDVAGSPKPELLWRSNRLIHLVRKHRPQRLLAVVGYNFLPEALALIKREYGVELVLWYYEDPEAWKPQAEAIAQYDRLFCYSSAIGREMAEALGRAVDYLPYGSSPERYAPVRLSGGDVRKFGCDVSFLGKYKERRGVFLSALRELPGLKLGIWGHLWEKRMAGDAWLLAGVRGKSLFGPEVARLFSASRINVNLNSWDRPVAMNLRICDVLACGGFLLTEKVEEIGEAFRIGEELDVFSTPDELRDKVRFYLGNEAVRQRIARRGHEKVMQHGLLRSRMAELLRRCGRGGQ